MRFQDIIMLLPPEKKIDDVRKEKERLTAVTDPIGLWAGSVSGTFLVLSFPSSLLLLVLTPGALRLLPACVFFIWR